MPGIDRFDQPRKILSVNEKAGFEELETDSVSSKVFRLYNSLYKLNDRNSLRRQRSDLQALSTRLAAFSDHIVPSRTTLAEYDGKQYTCVIQPRIEGQELKNLKQEEVLALLRKRSVENRTFVGALLEYFFDAIEKRELYPDIVGNPEDPDFFNSVNLLAEDETGRIMLCDIGLSPHEDTLRKHGKDFYKSDNVKTYMKKMREFQELLKTI